MIKRFVGMLSIGLLVAGCVSNDVPPMPPADIPNSEINREWQPYAPSSSEPMPTDNASSSAKWEGNSGWGYPPSDSSTNFYPPPPAPQVERQELPPPVVASQSMKHSLWVNEHVPAEMSEKFHHAVVEASVKGRSTVVDDASGNQYSLYKTWDAGACSGVDVDVLSPEGKLPIVSRGNTEICRD